MKNLAVFQMFTVAQRTSLKTELLSMGGGALLITRINPIVFSFL
jgi:hypothetical protein